MLNAITTIILRYLVFPGTQLRLVQPIITPPTPTLQPTPDPEETPPRSTHSIKYEDDPGPCQLQRGHTISLPAGTKRKISLQPFFGTFNLKTHNLFKVDENRIEQYFADNIVHFCRQYCSL